MGNTIYILWCLKELWNIMFTSRDFLRVEYNVLSKNVTRNVSQSEKDIIWSHIIILCTLYYVKVVVVLLQINAKFMLHRTGYMHEISTAGCYTNTTIVLVAIVSITIQWRIYRLGLLFSNIKSCVFLFDISSRCL